MPSFSYPEKSTEVSDFSPEVERLFPPPPGLVEDVWPPVQLTYLLEYLSDLGCQTVVRESHYVDHEYGDDMAAFIQELTWVLNIL